MADQGNQLTYALDRRLLLLFPAMAELGLATPRSAANRQAVAAPLSSFLGEG